MLPAVMDMAAGREREVQAHCPNAAIVSDLSHMAAKYDREAIDRVRVDRAKELCAALRKRRAVRAPASCCKGIATT